MFSDFSFAQDENPDFLGRKSRFFSRFSSFRDIERWLHLWICVGLMFFHFDYFPIPVLKSGRSRNTKAIAEHSWVFVTGIFLQENRCQIVVDNIIILILYKTVHRVGLSKYNATVNSTLSLSSFWHDSGVTHFNEDTCCLLIGKKSLRSISSFNRFKKIIPEGQLGRKFGGEFCRDAGPKRKHFDYRKLFRNMFLKHSWNTLSISALYTGRNLTVIIRASCHICTK